MKTILLWPLLLMFVFPIQNPIPSQPSSSVTVLSFKWTRSHQNVKTPDPARPDQPRPCRR